MMLILLFVVKIVLAIPLFPSAASYHGNATALQVIWRNSTQAFDRDFQRAWQHKTSRHIAPGVMASLQNLTQQEAFNALYDVMTRPRLWDPKLCDSVWKSAALEACVKLDTNGTEAKLFRRQQQARHAACIGGFGALSSYAVEAGAAKCIPEAHDATCLSSFTACVQKLRADAESTVRRALETAIGRESSNATVADQVMHARLQPGDQARLKKIDVSLDVVANVQAVTGIIAGTAGGITLNPALVVGGGTLLIESQMVALTRRKLLGS